MTSQYKFSLTIERSEGQSRFYTAYMAYEGYGYSDSMTDRERFKGISASTVGKTAGQAIRRACKQIADRVDIELGWDEILKEGKRAVRPTCKCGHTDVEHSNNDAAMPCASCSCPRFNLGAF